MIDIDIIRNKTELVKESLKKREATDKIEMVDKLLEKDKKWRNSKKKEDQLRAEKNKLTEKISKNENEKLIQKVKKINNQIEKLSQKNGELKNRIDYIHLRLPNILHDSVPKGEEGEGMVIRKWGKIDKNGKDHIDLMKNFNLVDIERAAKTAGARFYYLKNEAVQLELSLTKFALDELKKKGFTLIIPPFMIKKETMQGAGWLPVGEEDVYKIEGEDSCLIGTSEQPIAGYHMNETLTREELPKYYAGFSPCFRTEAGSHGRDTKGIFRVHQFEKVEMFMFTDPEKSWEEHEKLLGFAEDFQQKLKLPYRIVNIPSGDMGVVAAKKYDIETWLPGQGKYRESVSCSNCTDYQSRRLNIKFAEKKGAKPSGFVHTLNSTALAIGRTMIAILENYQDGNSIKIPKALHEYTGFKSIEKP